MMNLEIFSEPEIAAWLEKHAYDNVYQLALKKSPFPTIEMSALVKQIQGRQIALKKIPLLAENSGIIYPPKINLEQTSSSSTAVYKAKLMKGRSLIDITGGLGIDAIYLAKNFETVYHIEQQQPLQSIASHNFKILKIHNILSYEADGIAFLKQHPDICDVLYVDPARRNTQQKKVFLLEDLSPNILEHFEDWNNRFREIWVKLSPMIDIRYLIETIPYISHIYLIAVKNELKEVFIQIKKDTASEITAINLETSNPIFNISWKKTPPNMAYCEIKKYIYEPHVAIQKSGFNDFLTTQYPITKLHPNTQLFTSHKLLPNFPGRVFEVKETIQNPKKELKGQSIQAIHRNFPENLNQLKKKYRFTTDGIRPVIFTQSTNKVSIVKADLIQF